jgi:phenylpropionate dioxygenase-like ring-hydroxylating dioxygenase large terminal subunit
VRKPLARRILGDSIVLYRTSAGVAALEDRCPHKNVALSIGRVVGDTLQCRYHGWKFDPAGRCVDMPCHAPDERVPACTVPRYPAVEQDGWVWVHVGDTPPVAGPPQHPRDDRLRWFELHGLIAAPLDLVLENGVDCSHTGFAHKGLFRSEPTQFVEAVIEETETGVRIETIGEGRPSDKRDARLLSGGSGPMKHVDEFIAPHTIRVDYWNGDKMHIVTILVCTPEDDSTTRTYTRMGVYYRGLSRVVAPAVELLTRVVVRQDKRILNSQAQQIRAFGRRKFRSVAADTPSAWFQQAFRRALRKAPPSHPLRSKRVTYRL